MASIKLIPENRGGKGGMAHVIATQPGVDATLKAYVTKAEGKAKASLAAHRHDGDTEIKVGKGDIDYYLILSDQRGQKAAAAIEFGTKRSKGLWILHDAMNAPRKR